MKVGVLFKYYMKKLLSLRNLLDLIYVNMFLKRKFNV